MKTLKKLRFQVLLSLLIPLMYPLKSQEKQVPFFPNQDVVTIDRNYAKKMSLFTEYQNFREAQLYLTPGGQYALEIFYETGDTLFKERKLMTIGEKDAFLQNLVQQYAESLNPDQQSSKINRGVVTDTLTGEHKLAGQSIGDLTLLNQQGRSTMLIMNTIAGLGFYGWALPATMQIDDDRGVVGLYMLAAGTSFYLPYRITQRKDVTLAQASFNFYGISRGAMHGIFLGELLAKNPDYDDYFGEDAYNYSQFEYERQQEKYDKAQDNYNSALFGMGMVTSIAGGVAGYKLADHWSYNGGSTSIFQMWGDLGTISGLLLSDVFNFWEKEELNATFGTTILTSVAGMFGGKFFGDSRNYTLGDAIVYRSAVALSTLPLLTMVNYFEPEDETAYTVAGLTGIAAGGYFGWRATLNKDFSTSDGVYVALGELAGGLLGLGLGYLISPEFDSQLVLTTSTLGALGGFGLMYAGLSKNAIPLAKNNNLDLKLQLNPTGLIMNQLTSSSLHTSYYNKQNNPSDPVDGYNTMMNKPLNPTLTAMYNIASLQITF